MKLTTFSRLAVVLSTLLLWSEHGFAAGQGRPRGQNCQAAAPDPAAGEASGHGMLLQVFPRRSAIGPTYTGCQAVFVTTAEGGPRLAWLIEVSKGEPIRVWSADRDLQNGGMPDCRYRQGKLVDGDPDNCPATASDLLLPTEPAGCATGKTTGPVCKDDADL